MRAAMTHQTSSPIPLPTDDAAALAALRARIRSVPDWPAPGVCFRDITPLLQDGASFHLLIDLLVRRYGSGALRPDAIAVLDARGFLLGSPLAYALELGLIAIRKKGKLPPPTINESYELEYGSACVELHEGAVQPGQRVLLVDDLIATGGTMMAGWRLLQRLGAAPVEGVAVMDLPELGGSAHLRAAGLPLHTLLEFDGQ